MPRAMCARLLLLFSLTVPLRAATVFAAGTKTVAACAFAVDPAAQIISDLPFPADWKVVVVCNENMWDTLMRQKAVNFVSDYAFTFRPNRVTFVRAKVFVEHMNYSPQQVLKHELGHIVCNCNSEEVAWSLFAKTDASYGKNSGAINVLRLYSKAPPRGVADSMLSGY